MSLTHSIQVHVLQSIECLFRWQTMNPYISFCAIVTKSQKF